MKTFTCATVLALTAPLALAEEARQLDAHEHGVGQLDMAVEGNRIAVELHAPGADIVGFEYAATSAEDRAKIDAAVATLTRPLDLFVLPAAAGCSVVQASAELESEAEHDDHAEHKHDDHDDEEHAEHEHDDHDDEDHAEHEHDDHDDEDHAEHKHDDHDDEEHAEHKHDDHDDEEHAEHEEEAGHTEFHAAYMLECADTSAVSLITFAYFDRFPNALELEVQLVTDKAAGAFEVTRDAPTLDLRSMF